MDEKYIEQAAAIELATVSEAVRRARASLPKIGKPTCDYGDAIPEPRRAMGYSNCVVCQQELESYARRKRS